MRQARQRRRRRTADASGPGPAAPPPAGPAFRGGEPSRFLGRPAVDLDAPQVEHFLTGKVILVTGAGGSIGSEICRQAMKFSPARLVLVEQAENNLFEIDQELRRARPAAPVVPYVADVCDAARVARVFAAERPQVVLHCAAHKHVPMMELNPGEAIKNNVFGTVTVADAALAAGAQAFVLVSTDKAVNPTSVMGAAKRFAEVYTQVAGVEGVGSGREEVGSGQWAVGSEERQEEGSPLLSSLPTAQCPLPTSSPTRFVAVRFGNVLDSSGSVVPIFRRQIAAGGPVTVTHPEMRRYFMTIPEASQLVLQAGAMGRGGEVFVLDMGEPVRILDLAREMIERAGLRVGRDVAIEFTGVRPGEKLHEELYAHTEQTRPTTHPKIRVWRLPPADPGEVRRALGVLGAAADGTRDEAVAALCRCVPEYRPAAPPDVTPQTLPGATRAA